MIYKHVIVFFIIKLQILMEWSLDIGFSYIIYNN